MFPMVQDGPTTIFPMVLQVPSELPFSGLGDLGARLVPAA